MNGSAMQATVTRLRAEVAALGPELPGLDGVTLMGVLEDLERLRRSLDGLDAHVLAHVEQRRLDGDYGATSVPDLLAQRLRINHGEAKARVKRAGDIGPRFGATGERLPVILPACAASLRAGSVSVGHVGVIARALDRIPADIAYEAAPVAEAFLVQAAQHENPVALSKTADILIARLDPDGQPPREDLQQRRREFTLTPARDGMTLAKGLLTPECGAALKSVLDALSAPAPAAVVDGMPDPVPDERTAAQRRHDAVHDLCLRVLRSGTLPDSGGIPATVLVTMTANQYSEMRGGAEAGGRSETASSGRVGRSAAGGAAAAGCGGSLVQTGHGDLLSTGQVRNLVGDGTIQSVVMDKRGAPLFLGRRQRLASPSQRIALAARDGGCTFPGCTRPPAWCEAHHVVPWTPHGRTDIDNLTLLCGFHHREHERRGWSAKMINGIPWWLPPPWLDPHQRPMRNTAHHPTEIDFCTAPTPRPELYDDPVPV